MAITLTLLLIALLLFLGLKSVCAAYAGGTSAGRRTLSKLSRWEQKRTDAWAAFPLKQFLALTARLVYLDEATAAKLRKTLFKAELNITPQEYTARKVLTAVFGICLTALCLFSRFYFGIVVALLLASIC